MKSIFSMGLFLLLLSGCGEDDRCSGTTSTLTSSSTATTTNGKSAPLSASAAISSPNICSINRSANPGGCTVNQYTGKCD